MKYIKLVVMIFDPLSQTVTNLYDPLKMYHTSDQKQNIKKEILGVNCH